MKRLLLLMAIALLLLGSGQLYGQQKLEKESRIKENEVPRLSRLFIDSLGLQNKVKWYLEEGLDRKSIEAKFTANKARYSVEFDDQGNLEDVEVLTKWGALEQSLRQTIVGQLHNDCRKVKVQRLQIQYTGDRDVLLELVKTKKSTGNHAVRYEVVVRCRTEKNTVQYEYLFSDAGEKLSRSEIVFKNATNLEY